MKFEKIIDDKLWAVWYDNETMNSLHTVFEKWNDPEWLVDFFLQNLSDLEVNFKITDVNQAIFDTIEDNHKIQCLILDVSPESDLDCLFRPLENNRTGEMILGREKSRLHGRRQHASWLRLYAIKLEPGCYIITGGAIKLTRTMQERAHTLEELNKMENVRNFLINEGVLDADGFSDYLCYAEIH